MVVQPLDAGDSSVDSECDTDIEDDWESAEAFFAKNHPEHKLSTQGKKDVGSGPVIVFYLGEAL